jgi:serine/threonine-protein kinase
MTTTDAGPVPDGRAGVAPGQHLGRYRLDAVVGHGASSTVFLAHDTALDLPVVVKVLAHQASAAAVERFRREILFSRRVAHPGFIRIFELHEEDTAEGPLRYLTMEYVGGRTLGDVMNEGPLPPLRALTLARALCEVAAAAHDQGVVHADLKPGNVMVRDARAGEAPGVVVLDFGAATAADIAAPGVRVGSVRYMAPELFSDKQPSPQTDTWAIGVILYGCLTGRYPFDGDNERSVAEAARAGRPLPPSALRPGLAGVVDDVVLRALATDRRQRYADCRAFAAGLESALREVAPRPFWREILGRFRRAL